MSKYSGSGSSHFLIRDNLIERNAINEVLGYGSLFFWSVVRDVPRDRICYGVIS